MSPAWRTWTSGGATGLSIAGPTFELLPDDETSRRALDAFRRHLAPGGAIMVPLWIPQSTPESALGVARKHEKLQDRVLLDD